MWRPNMQVTFGLDWVGCVPHNVCCSVGAPLFPDTQPAAPLSSSSKHQRTLAASAMSSDTSAAARRLELLSRQLTSASISPQLERQDTQAEERPAPGGGRGALNIVDHRTGKSYKVRGRGLWRYRPTGLDLATTSEFLLRRWRSARAAPSMQQH